MKDYWQVILAVFFLFPCLGNSALAQGGQGPKMVLKEEIFDFKEVMEGEVIEHTFRVFNHGDQVLEIKKVAPG